MTQGASVPSGKRQRTERTTKTIKLSLGPAFSSAVNSSRGTSSLHRYFLTQVLCGTSPWHWHGLSVLAHTSNPQGHTFSFCIVMKVG